MKKKIVSLSLALMMMIGATCALATDTATVNGTSFSGKVEYSNTLSLLAPFGGRLEDYTLKAGDEVSQGQELFTLTTEKVYASTDGTIRGVRAQAGDDAQEVADRYGALAYIEPTGQLVVNGTTSNAYKNSSNGNVNQLIHEGETIYIRSQGTNDRTGEGFVTTVEDSSYTIEVTQSNLEINEKVYLYRTPSFQSSSRIGNGTVKKNASIAVTAEGSILRVHVQDGDEVKRGDLLFETVTGTLDPLESGSNTVSSPVDGVVIEVGQAAGTTVSKGDVLATLYDRSALQVQVEISENDLEQIAVGDTVSVKLDALVSRAPIEGTVTAISSISNAESGDATYTAYIELNETEGLLVGMNVSVYTTR